jgi:hypothetical protein
MRSTGINSRLKRRAITTASFCVLIISFACIVYFLTRSAEGLFNADSSDTILWAEAAYSSGSLVNPHFYYATVLPFGGHLLMQLLIPVFGVSFTTHTVGMLMFWFLMAVAYLALFRTLHWTWTEALLSTSIVLLLFSSGYSMTDKYFLHIIYYSLGTLFLIIGFNLLVNTTKIPESLHKQSLTVKSWIFCGLLFLWNLCTATNGIMALITFNIVCAGAYFFECLLDPSLRLRESSGRNAIIIFLVMVVGTILGFFLGKLLMHGAIGGEYGSYYSMLAPQALWKDHIIALPSAWVSVWSNTIDKFSFFSGNGLKSILSIVCAILFAIIPIIGLTQYRKLQTRWEQWILIAHFILLGFLGFGSVFGMISDRFFNLHDTSVLSTLVVLRHGSKQWKVPGKRIVMMLSAVLVVFTMLCGLTLLRYPTGDAVSRNLGLRQITFLKEHHLKYGYATFWNSNNVSVLSDGAVKIRAIVYDQDTHLYKPDTYQSDTAWYTRNQDTEQYFIMLSQHEYEIVGEDVPAGAVCILYFEDFLIFVYNNLPFPYWE